MAGIVYANCTGWVSPTLYLRKNQAWDADSEAVRLYPQHFRSDPGPAVRGRPRVEAATAAPGETRDITPPADDESQTKRGPGRPRKTSQ
jgi:hypothetical protein